MILVAPDKFKGTITAFKAASIIAQMLHPLQVLKTPMADGGEGTARAIAAQDPLSWEERDCYFVNKNTRTAAIDSSSLVGITPASQKDITKASSIALGIKVREILKSGCDKILIGVGGTGICDGGEGFLEGLGIDKRHTYKDKIIGLCDVSVPLLSSDGGLDTLSFAKQKGATPEQMPLLKYKLEEARRKYAHGNSSPFDGAGGGLGFAIATAIGAPCMSGAKYVIDNYNINWDQIDCVVTGEGCIDEQTSAGKVVDVLSKVAIKRDIPVIAIGGTVKGRSMANFVIAADKYLADEPLTASVAEARLKHAAIAARELISNL